MSRQRGGPADDRPIDRSPGRRVRDRELFDRHGLRLIRKDVSPSSSCARRGRLEQTVTGIGLSTSTRLLEVGCGAGFAARYLRGRYGAYLGVDHSQRLIEEARRRHSGVGVMFEAGAIEELDLEDTFDAVVMIGVLHHLEDPVAALRRVAGWLRPGGVVAVNEPRRGNPVVDALRAIRRQVDGSYSDDQRFFAAIELTGFLWESGLTDVRAWPQGFLSPPIAEVVLRPDWIMAPISRLAVRIDRWLAHRAWNVLSRISWNLVVHGRRPGFPEAPVGC